MRTAVSHWKATFIHYEADNTQSARGRPEDISTLFSGGLSNNALFLPNSWSRWAGKHATNLLV